MKPKTAAAPENPTGLQRFFQQFNAWFLKMRSHYTGRAGWCMAHGKYAVIFMLLICSLTVILFKELPTTFVPNEDQGYFITAVNLPEGTSLNQTSKVMDEISKEIQAIPGVNSVMKSAGHDAMSSGSKSSAGAFFVGLKSWDERQGSDLSVDAIVRKVNETRSLSFQGNAADGYSSGQAMQAMEEVVAANAPSGFTLEWSGQSREEKSSSDATLKIMGLSLLFVFFCLAPLEAAISAKLGMISKFKRKTSADYM